MTVDQSIVGLTMNTLFFSSRLKELRRAAGLTQPQLAHKAGLSKAGIADLEQGINQPSWATVLAIANALDVTPDSFAVATAISNSIGRGRPKPAGSDILECLPNWSERNLRWLINHIARRNDNSGQPTYTVVQRKAFELRDERRSSRQFVADNNLVSGRIVLVGVEGHEFGCLKSRADCEELAVKMGLAINPRLEYFGHAVILEV